MKSLFILILPLLFTFDALAQQSDFALDSISFKGLSYRLSKEHIIKAFGQAEVNYPEYECGFYTDEQAGGPYYQLVYPNFTYIGSDKEEFILESVQLDPSGDNYLIYAGKKLNGLTTKAEFIETFGFYAKDFFQKSPTSDSIVIMAKDSDDGAIFYFKNGKLVRFAYWSPC